MRNFLLRILTNRSQLFLLVLFLSTLPILRWFAAILLALATLRQGAKVGSQLVLAMVLPVLLLVVFSKIGGLPATTQVVNVLMLFGLSCLLRAYGSWQQLLQCLTFLGLAVVIVVHGFYPDIATTWQALLKPELATLKALPAALSGGLSEAELPAMLQRIARVATGLQVMVVSAMLLVNVAFGRYVQAALYNPGGLKAELYQLRLSKCYASVLVGLLVIALLSRQAIVLDCLAVVVLPLIVSGLSLVHYLTARSSRQSLWLVFCYIALLLFPPEVLVLLVGASLTDAWWNVRQRYALKR